MSSLVTPSLRFRRATVEDVPAIVRMATQLHAAEGTNVARVITAEGVAELVRGFTDAGALALIAERDGVDVVGMIGVLTFTVPLTTDKEASAICWPMHAELRLGSIGREMIAQAEAWARAEGATRFQMIAMSDRAGALYEAMGFTKIETHYAKRLDARIARQECA
jgi:N-acetylglutamate synthase-like GNAT family acetyltransferase